MPRRDYPLERHTPLRSKGLARHKRPSYPPAALLRERREWSQRVTYRCFSCERLGFVEAGLDIHEISRRSQSPGRWCHPANFLLLCRRCHDERFANVTLAPLAAQAALKKLRDPAHWDYEAFVEIVGRGPRCVTPEEINLCYRMLLMMGYE